MTPALQIRKIRSYLLGIKISKVNRAAPVDLGSIKPILRERFDCLLNHFARPTAQTNPSAYLQQRLRRFQSNAAVGTRDNIDSPVNAGLVGLGNLNGSARKAERRHGLTEFGNAF
jgi:hypothetical protein